MPVAGAAAAITDGMAWGAPSTIRVVPAPRKRARRTSGLGGGHWRLTSAEMPGFLIARRVAAWHRRSTRPRPLASLTRVRPLARQDNAFCWGARNLID